MITATPVKYEIYEDKELLAVIDMFDEGGSTIEIRAMQNHNSWTELSAVIYNALRNMHENP